MFNFCQLILPTSCFNLKLNLGIICFNFHAELFHWVDFTMVGCHVEQMEILVHCSCHQANPSVLELMMYGYLVEYTESFCAAVDSIILLPVSFPSSIKLNLCVLLLFASYCNS